MPAAGSCGCSSCCRRRARACCRSTRRRAFSFSSASVTFTGPMVAAFVVTAVTEGHDACRAAAQTHRCNGASTSSGTCSCFSACPQLKRLGAVAMPRRGRILHADRLAARADGDGGVFRLSGDAGRPARRGDRLARTCPAAPARLPRACEGELDPRLALGVLAFAHLVQWGVVRADAAQHRRLCLLDRRGDVHLHLGDSTTRRAAC